eukprot:gene3753-4275_t
MNRTRTDIRKNSRVSEHVVSSLQACPLDAAEELLSRKIKSFDTKIESPELLSRKNNLRGLRAVLQELLCIININGRELRCSYLPFLEAFTMFLSFHPDKTIESLKDSHMKKAFIELLCHPKHGIPVYIVDGEYIILRSKEVDLDLFLEEMITKESNTQGSQLTRHFVESLLRNMDSAWDRKILKVALGATHTRQQLSSLGISSRIETYTQSVLQAIEQRNEVESEAHSLVTKNLTSRADNISKRINNLNFKRNQKFKEWNDIQINEIESEIEDLMMQQDNLKKILENNQCKPMQKMIKRKKQQLIKDRRIGLPKTRSGRPQMLDETDEQYILQCIESKATAHGRRHDNVMYMHHRVKKKDFLKLANNSRIARGLTPIKSSTTVFNRARARSKRSIQAKRHLGLGLFCSKKPPKLQDNENILTHYQRAFKKGILMAHCGTLNNENDAKYNFIISRDDKAYICPGTSTGMQSARNVRIIQSCNLNKQRVLPKYDFPERLVNATPGVNRIMEYKIEEQDGKPNLKLTDSDVVVFNRPKHFVGSNGSVWASEFMRLRYEESFLFCVNKEEITMSTPALIKIADQVKLYCLMSNKDDVMNILEDSNCFYREYETARASQLYLMLNVFQDAINNSAGIFSDIDLDILQNLISSVEELTKLLQGTSANSEIWIVIKGVLQSCSQFINNIAAFLPKLKSRILEFTDGGPGVGVSNHDVKLRCAEIILLTNADYYIRHHLASGDSSQNEVERCQSYVGDAICDGGAIDWEYRMPFEGLTEERIANISLDEMEQHEYDRMKYNAFQVCEELTCRIDGAVAPGGFMKAYTSDSAEDLFFKNHKSLKEFISKAGSGKPCPGQNYFHSLKTFMETHMETGEKYIEYVKCTCGECIYCSKDWVGPPCTKVPKPYPDYDAEGLHYKSVFLTPNEIDGRQREIDDFQPRKQAEILFKEGKLDKEGDIATFSKKFIVEIDKVRKYVQHLTHLSIKKKKRAEQRVHIERQEKSKGFADYDWKNLFHKGMLAKLTVYTLDKYLAHFNLKNTLKLRKAEKVQAIQSHLIATMDTGHRDDEIEYMEVEPQEQAMQEQDSDKDMNSETSDEDIVIRDMNPSDSSSESTDEEADSFDASSIFTTLRSGRVAVNHRAANYVS